MKKRKKITAAQEKRNDLVEKNIGLAVHFADTFQASHMEYEDLVQEAYLGLIDAADRFDPQRGTAFSTYARWHIVKRVMHAIHNSNEIVRTPRRRPSIICGPLDNPEVSVMVDPRASTAETMDEDEMICAVRICIKQLPSREAVVVRLRYGVNTAKMTLAKVGDILGVTAERVRQIQNSAEEKLRAFLGECAILKEHGADTAGHQIQPAQPPN